MNHQNRRRRLVIGGVVAAAAAAVVGGVALVAGPALAAATPSPGASQAYGQHAPMNGTGVPPQRPDEKVLTGTDADKARAAALKAVPGATVIRVETDADGAVYEAHLRKSDGSLVTVKMDKNFTVTATESGMGAGGPGRPHDGGPGGAPSAAPTR